MSYSVIDGLVVYCYCTLSLLYFYNVFSYSAIQPQVCNILSVLTNVYEITNALLNDTITNPL